MPRRDSRLTLTVTEVRVERLQEISAADAMAEGVEPQPYHEGRWIIGDGISYPSSCTAYAALWDKINGAGAWDKNPWVAVYSFTRRIGNIDEAAR